MNSKWILAFDWSANGANFKLSFNHFSRWILKINSSIQNSIQFNSNRFLRLIGYPHRNQQSNNVPIIADRPEADRNSTEQLNGRSNPMRKINQLNKFQSNRRWRTNQTKTETRRRLTETNGTTIEAHFHRRRFRADASGIWTTMSVQMNN